MGRGVDLNGSGEFLIAGAPEHDSPNGGASGLARIYQFDIDPSLLNTQSLSGDSFKIYPNPSEGIFSLKLSQIDNYEMSIYDLYGRSVYFKELKENTTTYNISIPNLRNGV